MVAEGTAAEPEPIPPSADALVYLIDMGGQLAALSLKAGRPQAAVHFLRAALALQQGQAENAAPGDAA